MKPKIYSICMAVMLSAFGNYLYAQANTALSNLVSPVAVNQNMLPGVTNTRSLGNAARTWKDIYIGSAYYLNNVLTIHATGTNNFFAGSLSGSFTVTGGNNTGIGFSSLNKLSSGTNNTGLGFNALFNTTSGIRNTGLGNNALYNNTTGWLNTAIGNNALFFNVSGSYNVAIGEAALNKNVTGSSSVAVGENALYNSVSNAGSNAVGSKALYSNTSGAYNNAFGQNALYSNVSSGYSTAMGYGALYFNTVNYSTAFGAFALYFNSTGAGNTATGTNALYQNTTGSRNVANGFHTLEQNTTGSDNTATGHLALSRNNGSWNSAVGVNALSRNTSGSYNTSVGYNALTFNTSGPGNAALGYYALTANSTGSGNTAIGSFAQENTTTGSFNTGIGRFSLGNNTTGIYNTGLGYNADVAAGGYTNATAVGANATATASNQVRIGSPSVTSIGGYANWTNISDGRFKKNVKEDVAGLAFINKLKAVTYNLDISGLNEKTSRRNRGEQDHLPAVERTAIAAREKIVFSGFVAQDVEKAAKETGYVFSGVDAPATEDGLYGLRYAEFVVPLVKATQELSGKNDSLENRITQLQGELETLKAMITKMTGPVLDFSGGSLAQNYPNPAKGNTSISYTLPPGSSRAQMVIYDATGKTLQKVNVSQGRGIVNFNANTVASGTYNYSLFIDGKVVDTKKMVIVK